MIREFLRPANLKEALALKEQYGDQAVYMAGGARLNATPTRTDREVVISLTRLDLKEVKKTTRGWEIGALSTLQELVDNSELPEGVREAARLIYSRNMRQQMTIGGEVAANLSACQIVPALLALDAQVELAEGGLVSIEAYLSKPEGLITHVIIPAIVNHCRTQKVAKSCAGQPIVTASFAVHQKEGAQRFGVALAGLSEKNIRLHDAEPLIVEYLSGSITRDQLEQGVSDSVFPETDFRSSADYKRQISGVLVGQLVEEFKVRSN